jgi:hypothetical protein
MSAKRSKKARRTLEGRDRFDLDKVEPIVLKSRPREVRDAEQIEVINAFTIDDKEYFMPVEVDWHHAVKSLDIAAREGEASAVAYQLRTLLGEEGYRALIDFEDIDRDDFQAICELANKIIMSSSEGKAR